MNEASDKMVMEIMMCAHNAEMAQPVCAMSTCEECLADAYHQSASRVFRCLSSDHLAASNLARRLRLAVFATLSNPLVIQSRIRS